MKTKMLLENSITRFYCATCSRGNYKVVMTKRYFTHTFKVLNDPKKYITALIELRQKRNYTRVVQQNEELAYAVYEIDETVKLLNQLIAKK
jgi:uncharacterized protein (UPF0332 family)